MQRYSKIPFTPFDGRKGMIRHLTNILRAFPDLLRFLCNCPRTTDPEPLPPVSYADFTLQNTPQDLKLKTWPVEQLTHTVENLMEENNRDLGKPEIITLTRVLEIELDKFCPCIVEEQYDFCVVCSSNDNEEAKLMTRHFEEKFNLSGYVVWEAVILGRDQFDAFEDIVDRSSIVIFYITQNFTKDNFCRHLARNTFAGDTSHIQHKSVPIIDSPSTDVQEELLLVNKMTMEHIEVRFPLLFSANVRLERHIRYKQKAMALDERRMKFLIENFNLIQSGVWKL